MALKKMFQIKAKIKFNKRIQGNYFYLAFSAARIAKLALPGQFVNIRVSDSCEPLLRRPFSIYRINGASVEIMYEVVGKATEILSEKKRGEYLDVIGPLGNGFSYQPSAVSRQPVIVAGGMGVAPLVFLAEKLVHGKPIILLGAKTKKQVLCEKEFKKIGCGVKIATDDGSEGLSGKVTDLLKGFLGAAEDGRVRSVAKPLLRGRTAIYACGPRPMLKEISNIAKKYKITAQISLEEHMACGIGACLGCVVKTKKGFLRVCKEGPVFDSEEIIW
ncbi:MAG: dihydroorotate dehydrogenase electron transfer subunit [Candidatus Omnitrophota bacterium]|jgi:dihydroorotate dehydrogenase electron transfer subunit